MTLKRIIRVFIPGIIAVYLCTCKPTEIVLHGEISGKVTDVSTGDPVDSATVKLNQFNSTMTDSDGNYLLKNLVPGLSEIQITKSGYNEFRKNITMVSAETKTENFSLIGIPVPYFTPGYLDFGLDSTRLSFTISNKHSGKFSYVISNSADWIDINPLLGDITNGPDTITVTINRARLSDSIHTNLKVIQYNDQGFLSNTTISVYVNGVLDFDKNFYKIVKIGAQTWMAENLKVGIQRISTLDQLDNNIIEYYDYENNGSYKIYGGLYQWGEMMNYMPPDNKLIGTTEGICPVGWHIPTDNEWQTLNNSLGVVESGGKMKETGFEHWNRPNTKATNVSGFSGLPGGLYGYYYGDSLSREFNFQHIVGDWWTSSQFLPTNPDQRIAWYLRFDQETFVRDNWTYPILQGCSVRCIKDQP